MNELLVGYARVSTEQQDLTEQRNGLDALGVCDDRIYVDHVRHYPDRPALAPEAQPQLLDPDPTDPVRRLLFNLWAIVAEFEADLIRPAQP